MLKKPQIIRKNFSDNLCVVKKGKFFVKNSVEWHYV